MKNRLVLSQQRGQEHGEALVEFALFAPILLMILFALVDFGRAFDAWVVTANAAREGARYATVYASEDYLSDAQVQQLSKQRAFDYLTSGLGDRSDVAYSINDITVSWPSRIPGEPVTVNVPVRVQVWFLYGPLFGWTKVFSTNPATIQGQATMRI